MDNHKIQIHRLTIISVIQALIVLVVIWYAVTGYYYALCKKNKLPCQNDKALEIPVDGISKAKVLLKEANF